MSTRFRNDLRKYYSEIVTRGALSNKYHRRWFSSVVEYRFKTLWCHHKNKDGLIGITACNQTAYGPYSDDHRQVYYLSGSMIGLSQWNRHGTWTHAL